MCLVTHEKIKIRKVNILGQQKMLIKGFCLGDTWYSLSSLQSLEILSHRVMAGKI